MTREPYYDITVASTTESQADVDAAVNAAAGAAVPAGTEDIENQESSGGAETQPRTDAVSETAANQDEERRERPRNKVERRIDVLTSDRKAALAREAATARERDELRARLDKVEKSGAATQTKSPAIAPDPNDPEPKQKDFPDYETWVKAQARWEVRQELKSRDTAAETEQQNAAIKETFDAYNSRIDQAREKYDDWDATVAQTTVPLYEGVKLAIIEMDNGPDVAYYIGKHPELAQELINTTPLKAVMEVGRLSAYLSAGSPQQSSRPATSVTKAPAPITPTRSSSTRSQRSLSDPDLSTEEYIKRRNAGETN